MSLKMTRSATEIQDPPLARFLFGSTKMAIVWLLVRLYMAWDWIEAGEHKITDPKWMQTGEALKSYWTNAVKIPAAPAKPPITFDWYRSFLQFLLDTQSYTWFAKVIAVSEVAIGVALVLGLFTGIAAFGGGLMNWNFMMAGSASSNPLLFALSVFLILSWKTAGHYGLDRFLLPALGTPWDLGVLLKREEQRIPAGVAPIGA
jgi:thiosulfate dehydrogenase (quinone) large subunit